MDETGRVLGIYRAKVVDNKDPEKFGRVKVWIPALMQNIDENKGLWARAANNPVGGRNEKEGEDSYYFGTCYIPRKNSYVLVFFEGGNINRPYYFASLELESAKVLPENQLGTNYEDKWTIIKSHEGRCIVVSDDSDDARVEITGKKRKLKGGPSGDTDSVYVIDTNQTTILLDERPGKEKILIRTYKGDFININVEKRDLDIKFAGDINIQSTGTISIQSSKKLNIVSGGPINIETPDSFNVRGGKKAMVTASQIHNRGVHHRAFGTLAVAQPAGAAEKANPKGDR
jgi:hypothetical protein